MEKIVVVSGKRTPFGAFGGGLKDVSATDLALNAAKGAIDQIQLKPEDVDHIVIGNVVQSDSTAIYSPRHLGLRLGVPQNVPALGLNRLCGSGFQAWATSAQMILTGEASVVLAGGTEQMSQIPYVLRKARFEGYRMGHDSVEDYLTSALTDQYTGFPMAITAENLAEQYKISKEDCEEYSLKSQSRCTNALEKGFFKDEMTSVEVTHRKGTVTVENDEHPKPGMTMEKVSRLPALFKKGGTVTAATASGIVDGAAISVVMSESEAKKRGLKPLCRILGWASVGCDPKIMGIGPVGATKKVLKQLDMTLDQMDLVEVNEAFAAQYLAVEKELGLSPEKTNVNGGAIAIGHPLAATGTRIMNHLMYELQRREAKYALGSACIGGGQGIAVVIERI